jgi:hypothetical protein
MFVALYHTGTPWFRNVCAIASAIARSALA